MFRSPCLAGIAAWMLLAGSPSNIWAADADVFVDRFDRNSDAWRITHAGGDVPGIVRHAGDERPGLHFVTQGLATASAPWNIATQPFEFSFEVELDYGSRRAWRWPGVLVGLASAPPDAMDDDDLTVFVGTIAQGVIDGAGPNRRGRALITDAREQGSWRTMTVDATDALPPKNGR